MTQTRAPARPSLGRDDDLRLFYALIVPTDVAEQLEAWARVELGRIACLRLVRATQMHATLAFLGRRPRSELDAYRGILPGLAGLGAAPELAVDRYRETRSVGMITLLDIDQRARRLQETIVGRLVERGLYEPEARPWLCHLTVARWRERPKLRPDLPALATFSPSEVALYHSLLRPGGAQYEILEAVALGG